ncbi:hypothetical protein [Phycicoccus sp. Soil803]|uniref:hypothetical protein n=1 Tax=Phycicoccus sp. Soil803 TaxID=1736415 RepID=UPI0012FC5E9B|nr:hypothetical protein [Phycicoccus sp. Soil803]
MEFVAHNHGDEKAPAAGLLADDFPPTLPAWGAVRRPVKHTARGHLRPVTDRI